MALTQADVVRAAVALLHDGGLAGLTLRRLASALGVQAPTLYWHVRDKRHLLDLMAIYIMSSALTPALLEPAPGQPWWEWLAERARALRAAMLAHPDGALVVAGNRPTVDVLPDVERQLAVLVRAGFTPGEALRSLWAIGAYVGGDAVEVQAETARPPAAATDKELGREILSGAFPVMAAAVADRTDDDDRFEEGLAFLLDGMRARLARRTAHQADVAAESARCDPRIRASRTSQIGARDS
jgi:TetR/AcrR family tetracycline transcriptional repressor